MSVLTSKSDGFVVVLTSKSDAFASWFGVGIDVKVQYCWKNVMFMTKRFYDMKIVVTSI